MSHPFALLPEAPDEFEAALPPASATTALIFLAASALAFLCFLLSSCDCQLLGSWHCSPPATANISLMLFFLCAVGAVLSGLTYVCRRLGLHR